MPLKCSIELAVGHRTRGVVPVTGVSLKKIGYQSHCGVRIIGL